MNNAHLRHHIFLVYVVSYLVTCVTIYIYIQIMTTQLKYQGSSRTCNEGKEEKERLRAYTTIHS